MKIGVLSDTHIPIHASAVPAHAIKHLKDVDLILHAGDLVDMDTLRQLEQIAPTKAVCGNMDSAEVRKKLPAKQIIVAEKHRIGLIHGWGHPDYLIEVVKEQFKDDDVDVIVFGHSHKAFNQLIDKILFFNPGSPTDTIFAPFNSIGILDVKKQIQGKIIKI